MKTVKDVSEIAGVSIRTLEQYGEGAAEYIAKAIKGYYGVC